MKTEFQLEVSTGNEICVTSATINIIGTAKEHKPYVSISIPSSTYHFIQDKDLERFAVNILKALKSKKLKL